MQCHSAAAIAAAVASGAVGAAAMGRVGSYAGELGHLQLAQGAVAGCICRVQLQRAADELVMGSRYMQPNAFSGATYIGTLSCRSRRHRLQSTTGAAFVGNRHHPVEGSKDGEQRAVS